MACVNWCNYEGTIPDPKDPDSRITEWEIDLATFSYWLENKLLGTAFSAEAFVGPATLYVRAHSTACTKGTAGTEITASGYAPFAITFERVSDIKRWNPSEVSSPAFTQEGSVASLSLWDAASGGNYYAFGNLTTTLTVAVNKAITIQANRCLVGMGTAP